jgi:hypothetical protein
MKSPRPNMTLVKVFLAEIGAKGGKASRRKITPAQQAAMQEARKTARLSKEQNAQVCDPTKEGS